MGGIVAFVFGGLLLMDTEVPDLGIPLALIIGLALVSGALLRLATGTLLPAPSAGWW